MAEYGKLLSRIWSDPEFTKLDARSQQLYCLLISYSTRNLAGVLPMTLKRWAGCTSDASVENVTAALKKLATRLFVVVDWDTEEVLIRTYIRNDEVFRQPNLMQAARKFCRHVESVSIRWALFDELTKLPEHKNQDQTLSVANALVEGVDRPPVEAFDEPLANPSESLREAIGEDPGVGGYLSNQVEHLHLQPSPATTTPRKTGAEIARARVANMPAISVPAREIAHAYNRSLNVPLAAKVLGELASVIDECLDAHIPPNAIADGIKEWTRSDSWAPSQIPKFVHKAANRNSQRATGIGKPTQKGDDYDDIAQQIIAELEATA